jgi:hypothetical protein
MLVYCQKGKIKRDTTIIYFNQTCSDTQSSLGHWYAFKVCNKRLISSLSVPFFCICDGGLVTITFSGVAFYLL